MHSGILFTIILFDIISDIVCIPCNFKYTEQIPSYPSGEELERLDLELENHDKTNQSYDSFSCEDYDSMYSTRSLTAKVLDEEEQESGEEDSPESNEYEEIETSCAIRRRTIQPKALNNVYNKMTKVVNTETFVQTIHIEECLNTKEVCNHGVVPPDRDKKYICRQKFVKITLKALKEDTNAVFDDLFYYPSHCVCELVMVKAKPKRLKPNKR